jgi:hypothetical protein
MAKISKLEAARRQLDGSIRLYFENEDLLVVHALSRAAFRVFFDLQPARDDYKQLVERTISYLGSGNFNELTNFLSTQTEMGAKRRTDHTKLPYTNRDWFCGNAISPSHKDPSVRNESLACLDEG